jgi:amidase
MIADMSDEFRWWSAHQTAAAIRSGATNEREILEAAIARTERVDLSLNAVVIPMFERAMETVDGQEAKRETTSAGTVLRGVPMLLKDAGEELAGTHHWAGTQGLRQIGHRSTHTTELAQRFEALGFVIVGKSACPELSAGSTTEPVGFEPTRNPWDTARTVGGSSGGAAAAVAAGLVSVAHGSDATGSLRFPASHCGLVTLKPTRGRVPQVSPTGQSDPMRVWTQFALARDVEDLHLLFPLLATSHEARPVVRRPLRVGLVDNDPIIGLPVAPDCVEAVQFLGQVLEMLGHDVEMSYPPAFGRLFKPFWKAMQVVEPHVRHEQATWVSNLLRRPCISGDLSDHVLALAAIGADLTPAAVNDAYEVIGTAMAEVGQWWESGFDLLVTPVMLEPAWELGEPAAAKTGMFCAPFSFTGQPALVVPATVTQSGLPVGVQIIGRHGDDELLLSLGSALQQAIGWTDRRPPLP